MIKIARRDLAAAAGMMDGEIFEEVIWGFQLQQAVEKALKAWLYLLGQDVPFTHNLTFLLQLLQDCEIDVIAFLPLETYTDFAVQLRYDVDPEPQHLDRAACNAEVAALIRHVEELVSRCVQGQAPAVPTGSAARNGVPTAASETTAAPAGAP
jgi:HEPN domain-containing protein